MCLLRTNFSNFRVNSFGYSLKNVLHQHKKLVCLSTFKDETELIIQQSCMNGSSF